MDKWLQDLQDSYDRVAGEYVKRIFDELRHKPLDRQLLDRFAARVKEIGPVCDMGCGPGQVAAYLHKRRLQVCGVDLSPALVALARSLNPGIEFTEGNMLALDVDDEVWGGIAAFYSIIHIPPPQVIPVLNEFRRVLKTGGLLLLAFHIGDETRHLDEWWGETVSVDFYFYRPDQMEGYLRAAGFEIEEVVERDPYPDIEYQGRRAYIIARKPGAP